MNHVKTVLLWLLLAALPLQGYAAAASFMAMRGQAAPAAMTACHHAAASQQSSASGHCGMQAQTHHAHCGTNTAKAGCGNCDGCPGCASGCVAGAIAVAAPACAPLALQPAGSEAIPYRLRHMSGHIPAGPERPPHSRFA